MKKSPPLEYLTFSSREDWRNWLRQNFQQTKSQWVEIYKKNARATGLHLEEAVEEALCFGWIDGILKGADDTKYLLKFSSRKKGSI